MEPLTSSAPEARTSKLWMLKEARCDEFLNL
jgi:hypothetical protein